MTVGINAARNRLADTAVVYDDNVNLMRMPNGTRTIDLTYDVENRLARNGREGNCATDRTAITFWSVAGYRAGRYQHTDGTSRGFTTLSTSIYMEGRLMSRDQPSRGWCWVTVPDSGIGCVHSDPEL